MSSAIGPGRNRPPVPVTPTRRAASSTASPAPSATSAERMAPASSATRAFSIVDEPSASAAHTSARFVRLFEPGTVTVTSTGWSIGATARAGPGWAPERSAATAQPTSTGRTAGR